VVFEPGCPRVLVYRPFGLVQAEAKTNPRALLSALFDSCVLTDLISEVIELGTSDAATSGDFELGNVRGVNREGSLYADTIGNLSEGDGLTDSTVLDCNDDAFKKLNSLFATFTDFYRSLYRISRPDLGEIILQVRLNNAI